MSSRHPAIAIVKAFAAFLLLLAVLPSCAQQNGSWKNKRCAVVLTYDDALNIHLDQVIPALDSAGLKGTFYLVGNSDAFAKRIPEWRKAAAKGHELGNHTFTHPCYGQRAGREWVTPERDLNNYTVKRMTDEINKTNALLESADGKKKRTLACPCGDSRVNDTSYILAMKNNFVAFRDGTPDANEANAFGNTPVQWMAGMNNSGEELIAAVKRAIEARAMLIFVFHGVGGEHAINVSAQAHRELLQFLKQHQSEIWVAPFVEVAGYIKNK